MNDPTTNIAVMLGSIDPQQGTQRILRFLVGLNGARGGAVLTFQEGQATPYAFHSLSLLQLTDVQTFWAGSREWLLAGKPMITPERVMLPAMNAGSTFLCAVLFLEAPEKWTAEDSEPYIRALAEIVCNAETERLDTSHMDHNLTHRDKLVRALHANEWNVARVARILKVTRRTIYQRMDRYGIERLRVPKSIVRRRTE